MKDFIIGTYRRLIILIDFIITILFFKWRVRVYKPQEKIKDFKNDIYIHKKRIYINLPLSNFQMVIRKGVNNSPQYLHNKQEVLIISGYKSHGLIKNTYSISFDLEGKLGTYFCRDSVFYYYLFETLESLALEIRWD